MNKFFTLFFILVISLSKLSAQTSLSIDNGVIKVGLDLTRGGAINYISHSGTNRNLVNIHDEGRYIQQSYYAGNVLDRTDEGQASNWSPWPWNPIQVGDAFGNRAEILDSWQRGDSLYVKCIPMLWDMNNEPAEATMEQWTILNDNVLEVHNKLTCFRTDTIYGENILRDQELPAVYPISALKNLYTYIGGNPFEHDSVVNLPVVNLSSGFWGRYLGVSEHWMAFVDDNLSGMGVYNPLSTYFLAGMAGDPGYEAADGSTSYIAPVKKDALSKNSVYEYTYYIIIGMVDEIRDKVYALNENQPQPAYKTSWEFNEDNNFEGWQCNGASVGEVKDSVLTMEVVAPDPFMTNMDAILIDAAKYDRLYIKMKNTTPDSVADMFFKRLDAPTQYNRIRFYTVTEDTLFREYEIKLTDSPQWYGTIVFLRLDPVSNVDSGKVFVDYIRFAGNASVIEEQPLSAPSAFQLYQNYPNPFNPSTTIRYNLSENSKVKISIYDCSGRLISQILNKRQNAGNYEIVWNADGLASGLYFYRLESNGITITRKALLLK